MKSINSSPSRIVLVTGMHRSGTSMLAGLLHACGGRVAQDLMPASLDNPSGYWESRSVVQFNNNLLKSLGGHWNNYAPIDRNWTVSAEASSYREEALHILETAYLLTSGNPSPSLLILKDPRLCRLLPFWLSCCEQIGFSVTVVLMIRHPIEVALSLLQRLRSETFRPAAIASLQTSLLLWMRYNLDAIRDIGSTHLCCYDYQAFCENKEASILSLSTDVLAQRPYPPCGNVDHLKECIRSDYVHHHQDDWMHFIARERSAPDFLYQQLQRLTAGDSCEAVLEDLQPLSQLFDHLTASYRRLRVDIRPGSDQDPWSSRILEGLCGSWDSLLSTKRMHKQSEQPDNVASILLISGAPDSVGHLYRVTHVAAALRQAGWAVTTIAVEELAAIPQTQWTDLVPAYLQREPNNTMKDQERAWVDCVCFFRVEWQAAVACFVNHCRQKSILILAAFDDLIFDPSCTDDGSIAFIASLQPDQQQTWRYRCHNYRLTLKSCDQAVVTTRPLAGACRNLIRDVHVLPNGCGKDMLDAADRAMRCSSRRPMDGLIRLGFASGTATHQADFAEIVPVIADLLRNHANLRFRIVGILDWRAYPDLIGLEEKIEIVNRVSPGHLYNELLTFDINLCPLQVRNRFCEAKSALRVVNAAMVGVPSIVSDLEPLREAVIDGETGWIAETLDQWHTKLEALIHDDDLRIRCGHAAMIDIRAQYGWDRWQPLCDQIHRIALSRYRSAAAVGPAESI
ncbi:MAG: glycosyltransferase [Cyanobium sp.]